MFVTGTYDFYVFDLDGTLVDVHDSYVRTCFDRVGTRLEYEFSDRQATRLWHGLGGPRNDLLRTWGLEPAQFWRVYHEIEDSKARAEATYLHPDAKIVGDVDEPSVLVTHCQQYLTEPVLEALDVTDWFDSVVCCTEETGWKPDPEPVRQALAKADVDIERGSGILVGDGPHDIGAARNAGLDGAHVERHDPADRGLCVVGDYRLERVDELFQT
ncbi:MAG: HAD family hydrolase [Natronomonas sp.]